MGGPPIAMARAFTIAGYAIVSSEGAIADANGQFPKALRNDADQRVFRAALGSAAAVALDRASHEAEPNKARRRRLVLTRRVAGLAPDPADSEALFWNPAGALFEAARLALGLRWGELAVIGGTEVYAEFLRIGYDVFHLSVAHRARVPGGRPLLPGVGPEHRAEAALERHGLRPGPLRLLDPAAGVTLVAWTRPPAGTEAASS